ncbi:MAG TPA: DNA repair protein RecO [Gemmatimonadaceae bacterium]
MTLVSTDAVVLHLQDYLESSRIVRLATRGHGVQAVVARGARRPRSQFGQSLDLFASGVVRFSQRPGRDLSTLAGFDLTGSRMGLASNLDRFAAASALAELVLRFTQADAYDDAFDVLTTSLDALVGAPAGTATDRGLAAAWRYIAALGFAPSMDRCCSCESLVESDVPAPFSHASGGVVCPRCVTKVAVGRALPPDARGAIIGWLREEDVALAGDVQRRAHLRLLREFVQYHLAEGRELRAMDAWELRLRHLA